MRRTTILLTILALGGCTLQTTALTPRPSDEAPAKAARKATPTPSPTPTPAPTATPAPQLVAPVEMTTLRGVTRIDPNYIIAAGGGNLIGHAGGNIIAAGGGNLIGHAGGNYHLLAADAADLLPVKGMMVEAIALLTGERIAGPVETDEQGAYLLEVPKSLEGNLMVKAYMPALENDPRLQYRLLVDPEKPQEELLDEDTSLAARLVLDCITVRLERSFTNPVEQNLAFYPAMFRELMRPTSEALHAIGEEANVAAMTPEKRREVCARAARILLAHAKIHEAKNVLTSGTILDSLTMAFKSLRESLDVRLQEYPDFKEPQYNPTGRKIEKVTDVGEYILQSFATGESQDQIFYNIGSVFAEINVPMETENQLSGAYVGIAFEISRVVQSDKEAMADIRKALEADEAEESAASDATATP